MTDLNTRPRRLRRTALAATAAALVVGGLVACATSPASASTPTSASVHSTTAKGASAAPGLHMISHNGHKIAFHVTAGHQPAIVLEAGGGNDSTYWKHLVPQLSKSTGSEIITYDQAGMGRSESVSGPYSARDAASDLAAGLKSLGITHDAVLVPHSEAGEVATYLLNDDPGLVAGAVLVDASLPQFYTPEETARVVAANAPGVAALEKQKKLTKADRQLIAMAANYGPAHTAYHQLSWPADVPAIAIVSASTPFPTALDAARWRDAQAEFVKAAPADRRLVTAAHSSHDIPLDRPALVIDEVKQMLKDVR
ncbi:MAG TPA: alpha/beta hydrolase [Humibacter sp.]|jgi:pimeloyl-ACP methyl ester carboxylesterase|nr:alpha/beta hydrolase [Humibacter sp.]